MLKVGQLIKPEANVDMLHLEKFAVNELKWLDPFLVTLSLNCKSFSESAFREVHMSKAVSGLPKRRLCIKEIQRRRDTWHSSAV